MEIKGKQRKHHCLPQEKETALKERQKSVTEGGSYRGGSRHRYEVKGEGGEKRSAENIWQCVKN